MNLFMVIIGLLGFISCAINAITSDSKNERMGWICASVYALALTIEWIKNA